MSTTEQIAPDAGRPSPSATGTTTRPPSRTSAPAGAGSTPVLKQTLARVVHSEWIKARTLPSTWVMLAAIAVVLVGLGTIAAAVSTGSVTTPDGGPSPFGGEDPLSTVLTGANFAVLLVGVLGCLAGAREYGSRMIAVTVAAAPRRWQVLVGKATVLVVLVLPTALVGVFAAYGVGTAVLSGGGAATVALGDPGVLRSLAGMAGYLTAITLIGMGLGILLRSVASSIGALIAGVLILPGLAGALLPDSWDTVLRFLPTDAASAFTAVQSSGGDLLSAGVGALVLAAWVALVLVGAGAALARRDV